MDRPSIVVIEDNPTDVFLIQKAIAAQALEVDLRIIEDGDEAIDLIDRLESTADSCPILMLLDINLPRTNGFTVLGKLRSSKRCAATPVIIMTSSSASSDHERGISLGAVDYFEKPSQYAAFMKLGEMVKQHLEQ